MSSRHTIHRTVSAALLAFTLTACRDTNVAPVPPVLRPPLASSTWYAHVAEGQSLPALVAHALEGHVLVQDFLDSARLDIDASGHWSRALWITRYHDGVRHAPRAEQEHGTWQVTDSAYLFTAAVSGRAFALAALPADGDLILPLRATQDGYIEARLRTVRPASPVGAWRMARVREVPLPAAMHIFNDHIEDGRVMSIHIVVDSTHLVLSGNRHYRQTVYYTEWEGPNHGHAERPRLRARLGDHGVWALLGAQLHFESNYLQNHRFGGTTLAVAGTERSVLALQHGLSHGDEPVPVRYERVDMP